MNIKQAAAVRRLRKLASAARVVRRHRALQKYADAKTGLSKLKDTALMPEVLGGVGGAALGSGLGYLVGRKKRQGGLGALTGALLGGGLGVGAGFGWRQLTKDDKKPAAKKPAAEQAAQVSDNDSYANSVAAHTAEDMAHFNANVEAVRRDELNRYINAGRNLSPNLVMVRDLASETIKTIDANAFDVNKHQPLFYGANATINHPELSNYITWINQDGTLDAAPAIAVKANIANGQFAGKIVGGHHNLDGKTTQFSPDYHD